MWYVETHMEELSGSVVLALEAFLVPLVSSLLGVEAEAVRVAIARDVRDPDGMCAAPVVQCVDESPVFFCCSCVGKSVFSLSRELDSSFENAPFL